MSSCILLGLPGAHFGHFWWNDSRPLLRGRGCGTSRGRFLGFLGLPCCSPGTPFGLRRSPSLKKSGPLAVRVMPSSFPGMPIFLPFIQVYFLRLLFLTKLNHHKMGVAPFCLRLGSVSPPGDKMTKTIKRQNSQIPNLKPKIQNPRSQIQNPKSKIQSPRHKTQNPKSKVQSTKLKI